MKYTKRQEKRLPAWRIALAIMLVIVATTLLIYGSVILTARAAFSKRIVTKVYNQVDLWKEYGDTTTKVINIGIAHLTKVPYQPEAFVKKDQLRQILDLKAIKTFVVDKSYQLVSAVISDEEAVLDSLELVSLFLPVKTYVEKEYGVSLSEEAIRSEIAIAIGSDRYTTSKEMINAEITKALDRNPAKSDVLSLFCPGRAVVCVIIGVLLLLGVYAVAWPRINFAGALCVIGCIILCVVLLLIGILIRTALDIDVTELLFDTKILNVWINQGSTMFIRRAFLSLLGCIVPIVLSILYTLDRRHVKRIWRQSAATDK